MSYIQKYKNLLKEGGPVGRNNIEPLKIYKLKNYSAGDPKASERILFVIGKVDKTIHCLKLNEIEPKHFISFLNKIVDKTRDITETTLLTEITKKFKEDGSDLFQRFLKKETKLYSKNVDSYRVYKLDKISTMIEMYIPPKDMRKFFRPGITDTIINQQVEEKVKE